MTLYISSTGSTSGGSGGGHGGSGGRGSAQTKVGQGYDSIYDPKEYGSHGGFGDDHGNIVVMCRDEKRG